MGAKPIFTGSFSENGNIDFKDDNLKAAAWPKEQKNGTPALSGTVKNGERFYMSLNKFADKADVMSFAEAVRDFANNMGGDEEADW